MAEASKTGRMVGADLARRETREWLEETVVAQAEQIAAVRAYLTDAIAFEEAVNERKGEDDARARAVIAALVGVLNELGVSA